ncbi:hypothetical protein GCM10009745_81540 [Kribbella yunnanensis]|uniref:Uncharacterized protein n=1 Tax=Kribbella yunnanensis TaxID=190194 RepID=A0ABP4V982_9ACTN
MGAPRRVGSMVIGPSNRILDGGGGMRGNLTFQRSSVLSHRLDGTGGAQARTSLRWRSIHDEHRIEDAPPPCDARTWTPPALAQPLTQDTRVTAVTELASPDAMG